MKTLSFNSILLYVKVDETNTWHMATPLTANHVVVTLKDIYLMLIITLSLE